MNKRIVFLVSVCSYGFLSGFIFGNPEREVSEFIRQTQKSVKASHNLDLGPLPQIEPYQAYKYKAEKKDPFKLKPFVTKVLNENDNSEVAVCDSADCGDGAPQAHIPYFLESYELDQLEMMGTLKDSKGQSSVLIRTPDAGVVETKIGEYIGRNNGLIKNIYDDHIVIQEKQKVPRGWQNKMNSLELFK